MYNAARMRAAKAINNFSMYIGCENDQEFFDDILGRVVLPNEFHEALAEALAVTYQDIDSIIETKFWKDWSDCDFSNDEREVYDEVVQAVHDYLHPPYTWRDLIRDLSRQPQSLLDTEVRIDVTVDGEWYPVRGCELLTPDKDEDMHVLAIQTDRY